MPSRFFVLNGLAVSGALAASAAVAAPPNACGLLTPAQVGAAVGATMGPGEALNGPVSSNCKWRQQGGERGGAVTVIVSTKAVQSYEMGKHAMAPTPVPGIGDEAYQTGHSVSYTALSVKKGANALDVTVRGLKDVATVQAAERAVAKAAVARL